MTFNYGPHNSPPYATALQGELSDGITRDIGQLLAKELRVNARFLAVSRKRQPGQLLSGKVDVLLITNPKWLEEPNNFIWSEPLFEEEDVLIGLTDKQYLVSANAGLDDLKLAPF